MRVHLVIAALAAVLLSSPAYAQMQMRPTDRPAVSAAAEPWYVQRQPVFFAGEYYLRAGAAVFFNGNVMVRTGQFNGVPLYADATLEPFSVVYVPIGGGLLQPYERRRSGDLAGTVGSRPPSFPIERQPDGSSVRTTAVPPTSLASPRESLGVTAPLAPVAPPVATAPAMTAAPAAAPLATSALTATTAAAAAPSASATTPFAIASVVGAPTNDGIWINFAGSRWVSSGRAVPRTDDMQQVGDHLGFPVLGAGTSGPGVIYLTTREGVVAPFRRKS
jgi:hypothetical protein